MCNDQFTFVLVPGAWHGAWAFKVLVDRLRTEGHSVFALTLTGVGDRAHLAQPTTDLQTHVCDVVATIDAEELDNVILVGHSYAGCVISGVAEERPNAIAGLIYLDAIVLADGECLFDHVSDEFEKAVIDGANQFGQGYLVPFPSMEFLAVGEEHRDWMSRRLTPHPLQSARQRLSINNSAAAMIPRAYIDCTAPSLATTDLSKSRLRDEPTWLYRTIATGHDCFLSEPEELTNMLCSIAGELNGSIRRSSSEPPHTAAGDAP